MVKTGHRKFVKKEKASVKLKGTKTVLPKGQNVTDTSFKVRKIVVKEQLKPHGENETVTRKRHQNIRELMCKLTHHNTGVRQEALAGLKELVTEHPNEVLNTNLLMLLDYTAQLLIDSQKNVRLAAISLLSSVLSQISVEQLIPLYHTLVSYLICGMTHIEPRIQDDSLKLLDVLLIETPELISQDAERLLPHFLDMISHTTSSGRSLSVRLVGNMTAEKWRSSVLFRLRRLLTGMVECKKKDNIKSDEKIVLWDYKKYTYVSLYPQMESNESVFTSIGFQNTAKQDIKEYVEVLMPLLCDSFVEAVPHRKDGSQSQANLIPAEVAKLLQCIVDIFFVLWQLLQQSGNAKEYMDWFRSTYSQLICSRFMSERFPYSTTLYGIKRKQDGSFQVDTTCLQQNLGLCHLTFLLCDVAQYRNVWHLCLRFIDNCLDTCPRLQYEECVLLRKCFVEACFRGSENESTYLVHTVAQEWRQKSQGGVIENAINNTSFDFLCYVALEPKLQHVYRDKEFEEFLDMLPSMLTKNQVSYTLIETLNKIAARSNRVFSRSLDSWIESILDNLVKVEVLGCESQIEAKRSVINLLYWVKEWDQKMVENLENAISNCYFGKELTEHILDVIDLKLQYNTHIKKFFRGIPRWQDVILPEWHHDDM